MELCFFCFRFGLKKQNKADVFCPKGRKAEFQACPRPICYFLTNLKRKEALNWLTALPGVGKKTASCVMLFAYGVPFIHVDTHVERIVKRIGFVKKKVNTKDVQEELEQIFEKEKYGIFHLSLILQFLYYYFESYFLIVPNLI